MIINKPKIKIEKNKIIISSLVEFEGRGITYCGINFCSKKTVWFEFPIEFKEFVSDSCNGFLSSLVFLGMRSGHDIHVKGKISPTLLEGINQIQDYFCYWHGNEFKKVKIKADVLYEDTSNKDGVGSSFSGGIDSYYTFFENINGSLMQDNINHCIFIDGFDTLIEDKNVDVFKKFEEFLKKYNVKLIYCRTNIKVFCDLYVNHSLSFGSHLVSPALILEKKFRRYYIPSSFRYNDVLPVPGSMAVADGSTPITDPLFSTQSLLFIHHEATKTRTDKTIYISKKPELGGIIRCCWWPKGINNCCKCPKCLRTMLSLKIINKLSLFQKSFPKKTSYLDLHKLIITSKKNRGFFFEIKNLALDEKKYWVYILINFFRLKYPYLLFIEKYKNHKMSLKHKLIFLKNRSKHKIYSNKVAFNSLFKINNEQKNRTNKSYNYDFFQSFFVFFYVTFDFLLTPAYRVSKKLKEVYPPYEIFVKKIKGDKKC